jgi:uncharacterized RDD family membrane protein YckC
VSIEDFKMYEEWNAYRQELSHQVVEQKPRELVVARWGRRLGGHIIDGILLGIPLAFFLYDAMAPYLAGMQAQVDPVTGAVNPAFMQDFLGDMTSLQFRIGAIYAALAMVYYIVFHGALGQTPGKMLVGVKVVQMDGSDAGWAKAAKRSLINPFAQIVPGVGSLLILLNGLWPLWDEKRQTLGDKVAGTLVVEV